MGTASLIINVTHQNGIFLYTKDEPVLTLTVNQSP